MKMDIADAERVKETSEISTRKYYSPRISSERR
jgi:hypothetical protein